MNPRRPSPEDLKSQYIIDYRLLKDDLIIWLRSRGLNWKHYIKKMLSYLERFAKPIGCPMDVVRLFDGGLTDSQRRHLAIGLRNLFKFCQAQGLASKVYLDLLRSNLPRVSVGIDLRIPSEAEIVESLKLLAQDDVPQCYVALYNLVLDSGLRVTEAVQLFSSIVENRVELEGYDGFHVAALAYFRGTKLAYFGFMTDFTAQLVKRPNSTLSYVQALDIRKKFGREIVAYKYLRKFVFDMMTSEQLNIPESAADFIQGRVPKTVGARHYMKLKRKAVQFYPRYAEYITELREKAV